MQWRIFIIPDYAKDESVLLVKYHHSLADGIAFIMFITHLADTPNFEQYPKILFKFSLLQNFILMLLLPFGMIWLSIKSLFYIKPERNGFKTEKICNQLTPVKNIDMLPDLSVT